MMNPLSYSVNGASDCIVDSAWLKCGSNVGNPSAAPEPSTLFLLGLELFSIAKRHFIFKLKD